jgi:hypothetical protein
MPNASSIQNKSALEVRNENAKVAHAQINAQGNG